MSGVLSIVSEQATRRTDGRVSHNRAVEQYLLSNYPLTGGFKKSLHAVSTQIGLDIIKKIIIGSGGVH